MNVKYYNHHANGRLVGIRQSRAIKGRTGKPASAGYAGLRAQRHLYQGKPAAPSGNAGSKRTSTQASKDTSTEWKIIAVVHNLFSGSSKTHIQGKTCYDDLSLFKNCQPCFVCSAYP
eukprot:1160899-Pelagomonas_calceolata.AAC.1